jgi:hypothetical protein
MGGALVAQKDSFLAAAKGVTVGIHFQKRIMTGLFGGEGFIMQRLEGNGWAFVHFGGAIIERQLATGEVLHVDTGCVAAMTPDVSFDIVRAGSVKSMIFGGEGVFFAEIQGPGTVWLQSLPFSRLAGRILANAGPAGGHGEGSLLGGMFDGDNSVLTGAGLQRLVTARDNKKKRDPRGSRLQLSIWSRTRAGPPWLRTQTSGRTGSSMHCSS